MTTPALYDAAEDPALVGPPLSIYFYLERHVLSPVEFRPVKQLAIASRFHWSERTVERAIALLLDRRYIERGPVRVGEVRTYRLVYSRTPTAA